MQDGYLARIGVSSILDGPDAYAFATRLTALPERLLRSIEWAGVLEPPLLLDGRPPRLVSGFRRVQALDILGKSEVLCRWIPDHPEARRKGALQALFANAFTSDFSSTEKAIAVALLETLGESLHRIESLFLPFLGLGKGPEIMRRCRAVADLPRSILEDLAEKGWPLEVAERYTWFSQEEGSLLSERFRDLRLTASETKQLLEDWIRCAAKQGRSPGDLLEEWTHLTKLELLEAMDEALRSSGSKNGFGWEDGIFDVSLWERKNLPAREDVQTRRRQGPFLKKCPGAKGALCCNYWVLNLLEGCPLACEYCILQEYLAERPRVTLFSNWRDGLIELERKLSTPGVEGFRVGTGELGDSLAMERSFPVAGELIHFFAKHSNGILELKTKTDQINTVLESSHGGNVVIAWSLNPQPLVGLFERGGAALEARLAAAKACLAAGYQVAFHFDPMIRVPGWRDLYSECCDALTDTLGPSGVSWVSLGALRFTLPLWNRLLRRDPKSPLLHGEFIRQADGKVRYMDSVRIQLMGHLLDKLKRAWPGVPVYLCMEEAHIWRALFGTLPGEIPSLDPVFRSVC